MGIVLGSNFDVQTALPLDSRLKVADTTARDAIAALVRYEGMVVYSVADGRNYQLVGGITNSDWEVLSGTIAGGTTGQFLGKLSNTDYDVGWITPNLMRVGQSSLGSGVQSVDITFSSALSSTNYAIASSFENTTDTDPIFLQGYVSAKATTGFTFRFNAPTDSANYVFHYTVTVNV